MSIKLNNDERRSEYSSNDQQKSQVYQEHQVQQQLSKEDSSNELKTEFFTREGLWKLNVDCEYIKLNTLASSNETTINNNNNNTLLNSNSTLSNAKDLFNSNNEPVKISFNTNLFIEFKNTCEYCQLNSKQSSFNNCCKYCNHNNDNHKQFNGLNSTHTEFILFNYFKDIYIYNYRNIRQPHKIDLIDKRTYKTLFATCHDINIEAYAQNSSSLLVAVGFLKGEIHVYDAFRREFSFFLNNNQKIIDKSRVTCIKWIPNSTNLLLASFSSGNMYLFDINIYFTYIQTQQSTSTAHNSLLSSGYSQSNQMQHTFEVINQGFGYTICRNTTQITTKNAKESSSTSSSSSNSYTITSSIDPHVTNPAIKWTIFDSKTRISGINEFAFSPCGQFIALACQDGHLKVFNYSEAYLKCLMKSYFGGLLCVCWSHDGKYIATGGEDDLITVYSFHENRVACRGRGHCSWINSISFDYWTYKATSLQDESTTKSGDHSVLTDERQNIKHVTSPRNKRYSSISDHFDSNYRRNVFYRLASVGQDNQVAFWDLTEDVLREKSCRSRLNTSSSSPPPPPPQATSIEELNDDTQNVPLSFVVQTSNKEASSLNGVKKHKRNTSIQNAMRQFLPLARANSSSNQQANLVRDINSIKIDDKFATLSASQLCPKLDEVPLIEPLILKKISNERLSCIVFKEECMLTASQDGLISTWMRPGSKVTTSPLPFNESNLNSTCL